MNSYLTDKRLSPILVILLFFGVFGFLVSSAFDYKMNHEYPTAYLASDAFWYFSYSENVVENKNELHPPTFMEFGQKSIAGHPPIFPHINALLHGINYVNLWDLNFIICAMLLAMACIFMFLIFYEHNKTLAILSIPFYFFIAAFPFYKLITWGYRPSLTGLSFLMFGLYVLYKWDKLKYPFLVFGFALSFIILAHFDSLIWISLVIGLFLLHSLLFKDLTIKDLKKNYKSILLILLVIILLTGHYLILFYHHQWVNWSVESGITFQPLTSNEVSKLPDLLWMYYLVMPGILIALYFVFFKKKKTFLIQIMALILYLMIYIGFSRVARFNYLLPLFMAPLAALTIKVVIVDRFNEDVRKVVALVFCVLLTALFIHTVYKPLPPNVSIMNPYSWEAIQWVKNNIPENEVVLFVYDPAASSQGGAFFTTHRLSLNTRKYYDLEHFAGIIMTDGSEKIIIRDGIFSFHRYTSPEVSLKADYDYNYTICSYKYVYISGGQDPNFNMYLQNVINNYVTKYEPKLIHRNENVFIFENGEKCNEQQTTNA